MKLGMTSQKDCDYHFPLEKVGLGPRSPEDTFLLPWDTVPVGSAAGPRVRHFRHLCPVKVDPCSPVTSDFLFDLIAPLCLMLFLPIYGESRFQELQTFPGQSLSVKTAIVLFTPSAGHHSSQDAFWARARV